MYKSGMKLFTDEKIDKLCRKYKEEAVDRALDNIFRAGCKCNYSIQLQANGRVYDSSDWEGWGRCRYPFIVQKKLIEILKGELEEMGYVVHINRDETTMQVMWM